MNERQVIKKLQLLKAIHPDHIVLEDMKKNIYRKMQGEKITKKDAERTKIFTDLSFIMKVHQYMSPAAIVVVSLIIIVLISHGFLQNNMHVAILNTKLALAANQYEKARIAFADTQDSYRVITPANVHDISQSLTRTNAALSELKLKGEKGKYTAQQCHDLYKAYLAYLQKAYANVAPLHSSSFSVVKSQIATYEEQSEKKLNMYHTL